MPVQKSDEVHHQGLGSTRLQAECFSGSNDAPKSAISALAWVLAFIPRPVRNIKAAMQKSTHPDSASIVLWSWDKVGGVQQTLRRFSRLHIV